MTRRLQIPHLTSFRSLNFSSCLCSCANGELDGDNSELGAKLDETDDIGDELDDIDGDSVAFVGGRLDGRDGDSVAFVGGRLDGVDHGGGKLDDEDGGKLDDEDGADDVGGRPDDRD